MVVVQLYNTPPPPPIQPISTSKYFLTLKTSLLSNTWTSSNKAKGMSITCKVISPVSCMIFHNLPAYFSTGCNITQQRMFYPLHQRMHQEKLTRSTWRLLQTWKMPPPNPQHGSLWKRTHVKTISQSYSRNIHSGPPSTSLSTWRTDLNMSKFSSMKKTTAWTTLTNYKPTLCYLFTGHCNNKRIKYNKYLIFVFSCSYC